MTPDLGEEGPGSSPTDFFVAIMHISSQFLHGLKVSQTVGKLPQVTPAESEKSFQPAFQASAEPSPIESRSTKTRGVAQPHSDKHKHKP